MAGKMRDTPPKTRPGCIYRAKKILKEAGLYHEGWDIHHLDKDWRNNSLENLICVPRHEHLTIYHPDICERRKQAILLAHKKTSKPVLCIETGKKYKSCSEASLDTDIHVSCISRCCLGKRKATNNLHWSFIDKED